MQLTAVKLPAAEGRVVRMRTGISDLSNITFSYLAGFVIVTSTSGGASSTAGSVMFQPAAGTVVSTGFNPVQPASAVWGQSYIADVWKHFARKRYNSVKLAIVPSGLGAASTSPLSVNFAPYRSGNAQTATVAGTTGTGVALSVASIMGMKDNVEFPCYQTLEMDVTKYIAGGSGSRQNEFDERGDIDDQGQTTPLMFALSGQYAGTAPAAANATYANVFVTCVVDLLDFSGGFTATSPTLLRRSAALSHEKAAVFLRSTVSDEQLERCFRKMEMDDLKVSSRYHCEDTDVKSGASRLATVATPHISADGIRDGYIRVETDRDAKESYSKSVGRKETTPKRK